MRRSAGYVKTLDEDEYTSRRASTSWKKRLLGKKKSGKAAGPSASEKPLLEQVVSSDHSDSEEIRPVSSMVESESEASSSLVSSVASLPEQRPRELPRDMPATQEQSPSDHASKGVKEKQRATTPKREETYETKQSSPPPITLPSTPPREKKPSDEMTKVRAALSRPFGRNNLPPHMASNWVVEVSPAEWDADEERWKYRILVQRRTLADLDETMTTAFTWRSLADFVWLEQALRAEYHGALLLPLLSIAIGTPDVVNFTQEDVDSNFLKDWLNDVLNGIRGQGMCNGNGLIFIALE